MTSHRLGFSRIFHWNQVVDFEIPRLSESISRSEHPKQTLSTRCKLMHCHGVYSSIDGSTGGIYIRIIC
jgi:hypothetical protein